MMKYKLAISFILIAVIQMSCGIPLRSGTSPVPAPTPVNKASANSQIDAEVFKWTVCGSGGLNVRDGAGIEYRIVGVLQDGDEVEIFRQETDTFGQPWGMIDSGFVSMKYLCE